MVTNFTLIYGSLVLLAFISNLPAAEIELVSVSSTGEQANSNAHGEMSANGEFVLLVSKATNLVDPDTNGTLWDIFVRDLAANETTLASVNSDGEQSNGNSQVGRISADGRYILFSTHASNMPGASGNISRVYLHDRMTGETELISKSTSGEAANAPSGVGFVTPDGRFVTFTSNASNLVQEPYIPPQGFIRDRLTGTTSIVTINSKGQPTEPSINAPTGVFNSSDDGRFVAFANIYNDLAPGAPEAFVKVYVHDRQTGETQIVTAPFQGPFADGDSNGGAMISAEGRFVMFSSEATNLVRDDTNGVRDVFVRDLLLQQTTRVSVSSTGEQGNSESYGQYMSPDGRYVVVNSFATNLVANDTNQLYDGFIHDRWTGQTERATLNWQDEQLTKYNTAVATVSNDGRLVCLGTFGDDVIAEPVNGTYAMYVRARWKLGDVNRDGIVNVVDLLAIINAWGPCPAAPPPPALPIPCDADVTNDNSVNVADLLLIINNWG